MTYATTGMGNDAIVDLTPYLEARPKQLRPESLPSMVIFDTIKRAVVKMYGVGIDAALGGGLIARVIEKLQELPTFDRFLNDLDELSRVAIVFPRRNPREKALAQIHLLPE